MKLRKSKYRDKFYMHIPKEALKEGACYIGVCRNAYMAQWHKGMFYHLRIKFDKIFMEEINCPEDEDTFDVFFAIKEIKNPQIKFWGLDKILNKINVKS